MSDKDKEKSRYSDEELAEFDQLIVKKLDQAQGQLDFYIGQLDDFTDQGETKVKGLDDGVGTTETERLSLLIGRTRKYITHLQNARHRIKNKVYGVCRETGKLISKERLKAVPHATLSIEAKQKRK